METLVNISAQGSHRWENLCGLCAGEGRERERYRDREKETERNRERASYLKTMPVRWAGLSWVVVAGLAPG